MSRRSRGKPRNPRPHVIQRVHEVDVGVVGGVVGGEVLVDVAIGPVLGAHVVEVVGGGEFPPVFEQVLGLGHGGAVAGFLGGGVGAFDGGFEAVGVVEGVCLHGVAAPGGEVALGVGP